MTEPDEMIPPPMPSTPPPAPAPIRRGRFMALLLIVSE